MAFKMLQTMVRPAELIASDETGPQAVTAFTGIKETSFPVLSRREDLS